ncbi:hypothetical protein [Christiangramia forsetii]|uniref:Secreted protein n=2 Tax=Christiangramia forsetii TaxID=411153 RepID=A0LXB5_CHRFK|nr:hypothetical protein [Christiangramia forsetii]GGG27671.1 hypothetical protein GCM10011532_08840 [Christiangramia forsetii]CAL65010.1 secreted protein [Christiangramia forsetii KT0803]
MKIKATIVLLFIGALLFSADSHSQNQKMIKLEVDTENINENNVDSTATFGQPPETKNKDFTLDVKMGDIIIWQGNSTPGSGGLVRIKLFKHDNGIKLLGTGRISEQNGTGVIVGRVQNGEPGNEEKYTLNFEVRKRGSRTWTSYSIDPKLKLIAQD